MGDKVLIVGSGGREHALAELMSVSPEVDEVYIAPGNAGTQKVGRNIPISANQPEALEAFARPSRIDLTIVGPDRPLADGITERFQAAELPIFGPTQAAARIEWSKAFAATFTRMFDIPSPKTAVFEEIRVARDYIKAEGPEDIVIKADGLAEGKGVNAPRDFSDAEATLIDYMVKKIHGAAGDKVVIQEKLYGKELSVFVLTDGERAVLLPAARDYKKLLNDDKGPNTGGIGAFTPVADATPELMQTISGQIINPTLAGLRELGHPYQGALYIGLMLTKAGPKVIEYNARFGDPEFQALSLMMQSDLYPFLRSVAHGELIDDKLLINSGAAVTVALTSPGYPGSFETGMTINGLDNSNPDVKVFHAGTKRLLPKKVVVTGGRVLHITSRGETLAAAREQVYRAIGEHAIHFAGMHYRTDIAN